MRELINHEVDLDPLNFIEALVNNLENEIVTDVVEEWIEGKEIVSIYCYSGKVIKIPSDSINLDCDLEVKAYAKV